LNDFKRFIQDLSAHQMWLKLKELYKVQGFKPDTLRLQHFKSSLQFV
jgi:hypothetical protein